MHRSVLQAEVREWMRPFKDGIIVDGTLGAGGHAAMILENVKPKLLIGFDQDPRALDEAKKVLESFGERVMVIRDNFKNVGARLTGVGVPRVGAILLDLGVSSMQLDEPDRGFSFRSEGPIDMRMDPEGDLTAGQVVNGYSEQALQEILWKLGDERFSKRIAAAIVRARHRARIATTTQLARIIFEAVPAFYRHGRIHPATRGFQAFRIFINRELEVLEEFLSGSLSILDDHGRLVIISFHSLEDRLVKNTFRRFKKEGLGEVLTKKPVMPEEVEIQENPRSRSACLRVFEKSSGVRS